MTAAGPGIAGRMNVLETAKDHVLGLAGKLVDSTPRTAPRQTVTVACSAADAEDLFRDPDRLSVILGDVGEVRGTGGEHYRWTLRAGDTEVQFDSRLVAEDGGLVFTDDAGHQIAVRHRPAPNGLGTEITLDADLPAPGLLVGAAAFTVLYRARALLQTGEVPTIARNPSGRH